MEKSLWEILVPRCSNSGVEFTLDYHRRWDAEIRAAAGGITILKPSRGHWVNPAGQVFVEEMIPVRILCSEEEIDRIIARTIEYYDQEAVLAYEISTRVKLVHNGE